ncbi:hypothetical protein CLU79DRAFT_720890 [Phycomyces nitens]|nr:hypothetical protein CLU79DRAFT_720890 [Phycomyces nitens]
MAMILGIIHAYPSYTILSERDGGTQSQKCFDLIYPTNNTEWKTLGAYDITWKITGECQEIYYVSMVKVTQDVDGNNIYEDPQFGNSLVDISLGRAKIAMSDSEYIVKHMIVLSPVVHHKFAFSFFQELSQIQVLFYFLNPHHPSSKTA